MSLRATDAARIRSGSLCGQLRRLIFSVWLAATIQRLQVARARAEDHFDYKYETYAEEKGRILIRTHAALVEDALTPWLSVKGQFIYDGISGATPTGGPPPAGSSTVPTQKIEDIRRAETFDASFHYGRHTTTPQFANSLENDYESHAVAVNHAIDFNDKNTTLALGFAHDFDSIFPKFWRHRRARKDSNDYLIGVTQAHSPRPLWSVNLTLGNASGYLSDPYKGVRFEGYPDPSALFNEKRPHHRSKQSVFTSLTQAIPRADASVEFSYRYYHDSFEIHSHAATLEWLQKVGRHVIVAPMFRYYRQTAASFYQPQFAGDASDPGAFPGVVIPQYYSADYRLSEFESFTYGLSATIKIRKWLWLDAGYKRYEMLGLDGITAAGNFAKANIYTGGLRIWF